MIKKAYVHGVVAILMGASLSGMAEPERQMNVRQGPEAVFDRPLSDLMTELQGAAATGENGRIGNELVFWGYRLADGRDTFFFACVMVSDIDCEQRRLLVCPPQQDATLLRDGQIDGRVRSLECRAFSVAGTGDLHPGCTENNLQSTLAVGLVQCN